MGSAHSESGLANGRSTLTGRTHQIARGSGRVSEGTSADKLAPPGRGRERERVRGRRLALTGGAHLSGEAGVRAAQLGWIGLLGLNAGFPFSQILKCFSFIFTRGFKSNSITIQI